MAAVEFWFGPYRFTLTAPFTLELGGDVADFTEASGGDATAVHVEIEQAESPDQGTTRDVRIMATAEGVSLSTLGTAASIRREGSAYRATARVREEADVASLVSALAAALVFEDGGLVLHSTGVEVEGSAVLFIGPSGAGKTTAANRCVNARWFARDRAAVFQRGDAFYACGLPGGEPRGPALPRGPRSPLPLRRILRVRRGPLAQEPLSATAAFVALRESVMAPSGVREAEIAERIRALSDRALVHVLRFSLGHRLQLA